MLDVSLWEKFNNIIAPFATLYMYAQGITDVQIGTMLSVFQRQPDGGIMDGEGEK